MPAPKGNKPTHSAMIEVDPKLGDRLKAQREARLNILREACRCSGGTMSSLTGLRYCDEIGAFIRWVWESLDDDGVWAEVERDGLTFFEAIPVLYGKYINS